MSTIAKCGKRLLEDHGMPDRDVQAVAIQERQIPAAQENRRHQAGRSDDRDVFREEEHGKLHPGVFGEVAGHDFTLAFRNVERDALRFGDGRREKQEEGDRLHEDAPSVLRLPLDHLVERAACRRP